MKTRRLPHRIALLLLALQLLTCSGAPVITVDLVIAPGERPFESVRTVRLTASGTAMDTISAAVAYEPGTEVELPRIPPGEARVVTVEGIDVEGVVIAQGASDPFRVTDDSPERISVRFASCATTLHVDADEDGHGDPKRSRRACPGKGWAAAGDDCNDGNPSVHPGQAQYFSEPQSPAGSGKPFDYDCDGTETAKLGSATVACAKSPPDCTGAGWRGTIPACGGSGTYVECESYPSCAEGKSSTVKQTCR